MSAALALALALTLATTRLDAAPEPGPPAGFRDCPDCPDMIEIPQGQALIGAPKDEIDRQAGDGPPRMVRISYRLAVARTEVTRALYARFEQESGYRTAASCNYWNGRWGFVDEHDWRNPGFPQVRTHPAVCLSWRDATAFAAWLSGTTKRSYRLLSSAEFEYAARGGTATPWFWGTASAKACDHANLSDRQLRALYPDREGFACDDGYRFTAPVASFKPNPFGLYDMIGNAWEWTDDCFHATFDAAPVDGKPWLEAGGGDCGARTPRGGAWLSGIPWSRAATQSKDGADYRSFLTGFRVATTDLR